MKKTINIILALSVIFAFSMGSLSAQEWTDEQMEVWQTVEQGWLDWQSGDIETASASMHDKMQGWNNENPLPFSKAKILELYAMMKENMKVEYYNINPARITVTDDAAVVHYYFAFYAVYTMGEKKWEEQISGKNAEFYVKEKGKWLLLGDMTFIEEKDD